MRHSLLICHWLKLLSNRLEQFRSPATTIRRRRGAPRWRPEDLEPRLLLTDYMIPHNQTLVVNTPLVSSATSDTVELITDVAHGELQLSSDGTFVYVPETDYVGGDSFTYLVNNGMPGNLPVTLNLDVSNTRPMLSPPMTAFNIQHDLTLTGEAGTLLQGASDMDGDTLSAYSVTFPQHGSLTIYQNGTFTYQPDAGYAGSDTFSYAVDDGFESSDPVTITVNVTNSAPFVSEPTPVSLFVNQQTSLNLLASASDADGDALTLVSVTPQGATAGTLTFTSSGLIDYTAASSSGGDTYECVVSDGVTTTSVNFSVLVNYYTPPEITVSVEYLSNRMVTLSGRVTDDQPGGHTITFDGVIQGSVTADEYGYYSYTAEATALGTVYVVTENASGFASNTAEAMLASSPPMIVSFYHVVHLDGTVSFIGTVMDESVGGITVTFGYALDGETVICFASGDFSLRVVLEADGESASAMATDWWGLESELSIIYYI